VTGVPECGHNRMKLAKVVLRELMDEPLGWSELEKRVIRQCGTSGKFSGLMGWMIRQGYIVKVGASGSRGPYRVNPEKVEVLEDGSISVRL